MTSNPEYLKSHITLEQYLTDNGVEVKTVPGGATCICPFHDDHHPSLSIKGESFICWACHASGDLFTLVEHLESCSFVEALHLLAERYNLTLPVQGRTQPYTKHYKLLKTVWLWLQGEFNKLSDVRVAKQFLAERRLPVTLPYGYSASGKDFLAKVTSLTDDKDLLIECGLLTADGKPPLWSDNRLIFPFFNSRGQVIGFTGRALTATKFGKYVNSVNSPIFNKGETFFGVEQLTPNRKTPLERVYLCEGQCDCYSLRVSGEVAIASSGTAITKAQIDLLKRKLPVNCDLVLAFDGDEAGRKATDHFLNLWTGDLSKVRVLRLPAGDINDLYKRDLLRRALDKTITALQYVTSTVTDKESLIKKFPELLDNQSYYLFSQLLADRLGFTVTLKRTSTVKGKELNTNDYDTLEDKYHHLLAAIRLFHPQVKLPEQVELPPVDKYTDGDLEQLRALYVSINGDTPQAKLSYVNTQWNGYRQEQEQLEKLSLIKRGNYELPLEDLAFQLGVK